MTTEEKWSARVDAWRASGLSAPLFCTGKDFKAGGLRYWASRLKHTGRGTSEVRIARLIRTGPELDVETAIVVEIGGARVGVRRGFDREVLREVLELLGGSR